MKSLRLDAFDRMIEKSGGVHVGRVSVARWCRDFAPRCENPLTVEHTARPEQDSPRRAYGSRTVALADMEVRCRRCEACGRQRAYEWYYRASRELRATALQGRRVWFVTLTLSPASHHNMRLRAIQRFNVRGRDPNFPTFEACPDDDRWQQVEAQTWKEVQKYLKRLRNNSECEFRRVVVPEAHESGDVHYHLLVHEVSGRVTERQFRLGWKLGFAQAKLVRVTEEKVASYTMKSIAGYVSKSLMARVRASKTYGEPLAGYVMRASPTPSGPSDVCDGA